MLVANYLELMLLALSTMPLVSAFRNATIDAQITANQDFVIQLDSDFDRGIQSYDRQCDSFRTSLSVNLTEGRFDAYCTLVNSSSTDVPSITAKIPSSVGANGVFYRLQIQGFNQDPNNRTVYNSSVGETQWSQPFSLQGATGAWAGWELDGYIIGQPGLIPCEAHDCVRTCYQTYYPNNFNGGNSGDFCAMQSTWECSRWCTSTSFPPWEESGDGQRWIAAQASSSSIAATQSQTSTSISSTSTASEAIFSVVYTVTRNSTSTMSSTGERATSNAGQISRPPAGVARATAVPSLAPAVRVSIIISIFLGAIILAFFVGKW